MLLHIYICMFVYHYVYMHVCYDILIYIVGGRYLCFTISYFVILKKKL